MAVTQDVTVWITLGALTIPHAEDVPTIQTPGSQMSFVLQPFNYFDSDPSQFVDDAVTVHGAGGGSTLVYRRHGDAASRGRRQLDCVPVMVRKSAATAAVGRLSRGVVAFTAMMVATAARSSSC